MHPNGPTSVYRYFDRDGILLYVGVTARGDQRNVEHNLSKAWWPYVVSQDVEHLNTREEALWLERELIVRHRPPFNVQHNREHAALRAAYIAFAESKWHGLKPVELFHALDRTLPLFPVGNRDLPGCRRVLFSTRLQDVAIGSRLNVSHDRRVFLNGPAVGQVHMVETRGPLTTFMAVLSRSAPTEIAMLQAHLKFHSDINRATASRFMLVPKGGA